MAVRDPEIIKREIQIAELSASNCALQVEGFIAKIDLARARLEQAKKSHFQYLEAKRALEAELAKAMTEWSPAGAQAEAEPQPA